MIHAWTKPLATGRWSRLAAVSAVALATLAGSTTRAEDGREREGRWAAGDFHQHSFYTDGGSTFDYAMSKNNQFGLDWWANSEHGGAYATDGNGRLWDDAAVYPVNPIKGDRVMSGTHQAMWRWQSLPEFVFPDVLRARAAYPEKRIFNGYEWNVPSHEHCSTGIVTRDGSAISAFEYQFDKSDHDLSREGELTRYGTLTKRNGNTYSVLNGVKSVVGKSYADRHLDAVAGCAWMEQQLRDRTIDNGWIVFAHVERAGAWSPAKGGGYNVEHFRDLNNAGPNVCFGFEGAPGHQVEPYRGLGNPVTCAGAVCTSKDFGGTYGGTGYYTARVGGLWDALLGEGRHWFNFASSDYHLHYSAGSSDFYPGEYQKDWVYVRSGESRDERGGFGGREDDEQITLNGVVDGMRSGKSFFAFGDLIDRLEFTVRQGDRAAEMGETLEVEPGHGHHHPRPVRIEIKFRSPQVNNNGDRPVVDHVDLIAGEITGLIQPSDPNYTNPTNPTTRVIASFDRRDWKTDRDGNQTIVYSIENLDRNTYFRLRGTNLACGTPNQTGPAATLPSADHCSPLPDALEGISEDAATNVRKAFADLWFYSNPVYTYVK
jgi:hypothetical protein